ncbi:MAG TPA: DnaJ domain-containing protein [Candidatus Paceibacterota bacterium]|nr:DnaJ domain-containing protein [Candidatus Paceibacterota bacterium]
MPADPYTTLGVGRTASAEDIKKAYRKLAHQYHPDKKGGDEARFKEVNEAYQILSDPKKKDSYDRFGHAGGQGGGFRGEGGAYQDFDFDMGGFGSIFDMFTGGFGGAGPSRRPPKGEDLNLSVAVSKGDLGKSKVYEFDAFDSCPACDSTGAENGKRKTCPDCQGQGRVRQAVRTPFGTFAQVAACAKCEGEGSIAEKKCGSCGGAGRKKSRRKLEIKLPKNLNDRYLMAFPQEGNAGPKGTPPGDLTVTVRIK